MPQPDVVIVGAGLIGLTCALELEARGMRVVLLERGRAGREASWAAAGMLAAHDPANPAALLPLSERSLALYPALLERIASLCGAVVPFETEWVLERHGGEGPAPVEAIAAGRALPDGWSLRQERSLDPRKLTAALVQAVRESKVELLEDIAMKSVAGSVPEARVDAAAGVETSVGLLVCGAVVQAMGAWSTWPVQPRKGQMLRVHAPGALRVPEFGNVVVRSSEIYLVPRLDGSVVVGATVEDAGFNKDVHKGDLQGMRALAAALAPAMAGAPETEHWAGLRPDTPDHLPLLGETGARQFVAAGHFRNGVLLAPATARVMAQLVTGEPVDVDLQAFAPNRFETHPG